MRPLSELLQLVYDEFNRLVDNYPKRNLIHTGICSAINELFFTGKIFESEFFILKKYIESNRPSNANRKGSFWFEPYLIISRNKWLLKHIKINKNKENGNIISKAS